ncbi:hypothetical protein [uncultured Desulfobulbus sp.]|uniref:hypothetical protein n=1 Tax=uncultured Desulfobulbus sp. TaxID=239745 RepID=UPI0029C8E636|nr:hypothetical protein [uncultured Desulfobulbus sp.]
MARKGDQLQPADHHINDEDNLGQTGEVAKTAHGANGTVSRPDIARVAAVPTIPTAASPSMMLTASDGRTN